MPQGDVIVRARNGMFYINPILVFTEGFLRVRGGGSAEVTLWVPHGGKPVPKLSEVLDRVLGPEGYTLGRSGEKTRAHDAQIIGSDPPLFAEAISSDIKLTHRIPTPRFFSGVERYMRDQMADLVDFPQKKSDLREPALMPEPDPIRYKIKN